MAKTKVTDKYPSEPLNEPYDCSSLAMMNMYTVKQLADTYGIQIDISFKPAGLRLDFIRKQKDSRSVKKITEYVDNDNLKNLYAVITGCVQRLMFC